MGPLLFWMYVYDLTDALESYLNMFKDYAKLTGDTEYLGLQQWTTRPRQAVDLARYMVLCNLATNRKMK